MRQTPELQKALLSATKPTDTETDLAEEFKHLADMQRNDKRRTKPFKTVEEMNKAIMNKARSEKTITLDDEVTESVTIENATIEKRQQTLDKVKDGKSVAKANTGNYLSKENLQEHERMYSNAAVEEKSPGKKMNDVTRPTKPTRPDKPHKPKHEKKDQIKQVDKPTDELQNEKLFKPSKPRKRKRLPPLTGLVPQSSRAESYRSIYIRRQKIAAEMIKEQQIHVRRAHSATDLHHDAGKHNTTSPRKLKTKPVKGGDDEESKEKTQRERFQKDTHNYFTRGTKDRYKSNRTEFRTDVPTTSRVVTNGEKNVTEHLPKNMGFMTERLGMDKNATRKLVKERVLWDKEREDMYMKEMDLFAVVTNEAKQNQESEAVKNEDFSENDDKRQMQTQTDNNKIMLTENEPNGQLSNYGGGRFNEGDTEPIGAMSGSPQNSEINRYRRNSSFKELEIQDPSSMPQRTTDATHMVMTTPQEELQENEIMTINMSRRESSPNVIHANDTMHAQPIFNQNSDPEKPYNEIKDTDREAIPTTNHMPTTDDATEEYKITQQVERRRRSSATKSGVARSVATTSTKSKPVKLVISSELFSDKNKSANTVNGDSGNAGSGTVDTSLRTSAKTTESGSCAIQSMTPRAEDVVIRDKLTLEIDVGDSTREYSNITREKAKIKRFWEVVGGKDVENEAEIYGDADPSDGDKVLMTRVRKERKMSARSKSSKQTDGTNVTSQKLGKYNVTVEVV